MRCGKVHRFIPILVCSREQHKDAVHRGSALLFHNGDNTTRHYIWEEGYERTAKEMADLPLYRDPETGQYHTKEGYIIDKEAFDVSREMEDLLLNIDLKTVFKPFVMYPTTANSDMVLMGDMTWRPLSEVTIGGEKWESMKSRPLSAGRSAGTFSVIL